MEKLLKSPLVNKVREALKRQIGPLTNKKRIKIIVGFSGGKDSTFLLCALNLLQKRFNLKLFAFHLNHQIRGKETKRDEKFCRSFAQRLKIPIIIQRYDVKKFAKKKKISLEVAGRIVRYRFLEETRKKKKIDFIALGHTATDNCETMLLALIQGKGLSGIAGIPETRDKIIRPLIDIKKEEIEEFLRSNNIPWVFDTTNLSLSHPRNYIRHIILPLLKRINPNLETTMRQTARILQEEDAYQRMMTKRRMEDAKCKIRKVNGGYLIDKQTFLSYNLGTRRRWLKELFKDMPFEDIETVIKIGEKPAGKFATLGRGLVAISESYNIFIGRPQPVKDIEAKLAIGRENKVKELGLKIKIRVKKKINGYQSSGTQPNREYFDWEEVLPPLYLRTRRPGDVIIYEKGTKKLQDLFVDAKIPRRLKDSIPLILDQKGILWVLGLRRANRAKITEGTKKILEIKFSKDLPEEIGS